MRSFRTLLPLLGALVALEPATADAQSDFDPSGRRTARPRPAGGGAGGRRPERVKKEADPEALIKRFMALLIAKPDAAFPLQKLSELYRKRDGNLDKLVAELEQRAATDGPDQFNARLALAAVFQQTGRDDDAMRILGEAAAEKPKNAAPRLMLAALAQKKGDKAEAKKRFEEALPLVPKGIEEERITRELMVLCIELKDFDGARARHAELVKASGGSLYVKRELGTELLNRGHFDLAEAEFRELVKTSAGDNRALAPALRDLGKALAKQKKMEEALEVLGRARRIAGSEAGIRAEILDLLTEVFREQGRLVELIAILEGEAGRALSNLDSQRLATLGSLYEETGQVDKAIAAYREAMKLESQNVDTRVKLVHLLQSAGLLEDAIKEYEALIKAAPHNPELVFELAETYIQRGDRDKALKLVEELERRNAQEGDVLATVADFYERIEEPDKSVKVLERLANLPTGDHQYLVDLGDRYFQAGDKKRAVATWQKIRTLIRNRARAASILGEVFLDHDMADEALVSLREAVQAEPNEVRYQKQLAVALERTAGAGGAARSSYQESLTLWESILDDAADDPLLAREAQSHIVSLWSILRQLEAKVAPLAARLAGTPPDLRAGRLLAEVQRRLGRLGDSEATLRKVVEIAKGDEESLLALERVLVMQRKLDQALEVLEKLAELNPKRAREYYQRMAQYAAELYRDDDAIRYAAKAVELSPDDANGHHRLGQMYRRRQDTERAAIELRKAIAQNDRLFAAYFDLAELLMSKGEADEADRLYRQVVRTSRDEELVIRAARLSMQINLGKGTLESLERELLPVALGNPQKPVYRRLLVELYGAMTFPLVHAARLGSAEQAGEARAKLAAIGARAVKPLLDALVDDRAAQQRVAIEVLAYVQNRGAGPALFNFATGAAERDLRVRAMVACGALDDPALLPRYQQLLAPAEGSGEIAASDAVAVAAAWGVARIAQSGAQPAVTALLVRLTESSSPEVRAIAAIGLGLAGDAKHAPLLASMAREPLVGPAARAAAAHALGELGGAEQRSLLLALTDASEPQLELAALLALARLDTRSSGGRGVVDAEVAPVIARALLSEEALVRKTAMAAAAALASGSYRRAHSALPVPDGAVTIDEVLGGLAPTGYRRSEQAAGLAALVPELTRAAVGAVATSPARARIVAQLTQSRFESLLDPAAGPLPSDAIGALQRGADAIAVATTPGFVALSRHPSVDVRKQAIEFIGRSVLGSRADASREAQAALVEALGDRDQEVVKAALAALRDSSDATTLEAVMRLCASAEASASWSVRARAAEALGRAAPPAELAPKIAEALRRAATADEYALVREAAVRAAARLPLAVAKPLLAEVAANDAETHVREVARELLPTLR